MTKKNSRTKKHIDTYSTMYDLDIVVANEHVTLKDLQKTYTYSDGVEIDNEVFEGWACTSKCRNKLTGRYLVLVKYNKMCDIKGIDKTLWLVNTAAHEAFHTARDIYEFIGQSLDERDGNEPLAYFIGWITENIYNTWTKK